MESGSGEESRCGGGGERDRCQRGKVVRQGGGGWRGGG